MITNVFRWNGFEKIIESEEPYTHDITEMILGEELFKRIWGKQDHLLCLWRFHSNGIDSEGRHVYDAMEDPYEKIVERAEVRQMAEVLREKLDEPHS